jgi:predicted Zn finger-like uncharacterized protein
MIVICTKCKAKFRVADDRIGPRGARLRCSRCHAVFVVSAAPPPAGPGEAPTGLGIPIAPRSAEPASDPFAATAAAMPSPPDPFADSAAPFVSPSDPFAGAAAAIEPRPDPFLAPKPPPDDPFAPRPGADPFAASPARDPGAEPARARLATDLSDLLGPATPAAFSAPGRSSPEPAAVEPSLEASADLGGLSLEERTTPAPAPVFSSLPPLDDGGGLAAVRAADHYVMAADPRTFDTFDFGPAGGGPALALATETPAAERPPPLPSLPASAPAIAAVPSPPQPAPARPAVESEPGTPAEAAPAPAPAPRRSRLRTALLNTLALAALLAVTVAILVVWRGEGGLEGLVQRPAALLASLGGGAGPAPFSAVDVRSGVYEREKGPPVVFVRGKIVSRAPAPVRGVKVLVEVVSSGGVVARGEALAGAVPTPEELYEAGEGPALSALARAAAARAPREIRPGDAVPFLVAIADAPTDLDGASVRLELAPAAAAR